MKDFKHKDVMTVRDIFTNRMYVIPSFQRPYEWKKDTCEKLFCDILNAYDERRNRDDEHYFIGSLVMYEYAKKGNDDDALPNDAKFSDRRKLEKNTKGQNLGLLKVIDGQQRLTSLLILLIALRDCELLSGGKDADEDLRDTLDSLITGCTGGRGKKNSHELVRIRTNVLEDESYDEDLQGIYDAQGGVVELNRSVRYENYRHFRKLIEEEWGVPTAKGTAASKDCKNRREFTRFVLDHVQLLELVCASRDDAFKLFEVVNSRGMELSPASIMKPRVVSAYGHKDRKAILRLWNKMEGEKEKNFLLNLFLYLRAIRNAEKGRQDDNKQEIVDFFKDESLKSDFASLRKMYAINCYTQDAKLVVLQAILNKFPLRLHRSAYYKYMLDLFERNELFVELSSPGHELEFGIKDASSEILKPAYEFCEKIIRYYLGCMLTDSSTRDQIRTLFKSLVVAVAKDDKNKMAVLSDLPEGLAGRLDDFKTRDCYESMQDNLSFVLVWLCTYLKYRDDDEQMGQYGQLFVDDDGSRKTPDREHIHPKDWSKADGWTQETHDAKVHLIGNLIPLEKEINRTAGNDSLDKKITGKGSNRKVFTYEKSSSPEALEITTRYHNREFFNWLPEHVDLATDEKISLLKDFFGLGK